MRTADLDFHLPPELIAQSPAPDRAASRLLHYRRADWSITHRAFADLPGILRPGDLLVFNNTKVVPARFMLRRPSGGIVEGLFIHESSPGHWRVMLKNAGNTRQLFANELSAEVIEKHEGGEYTIQLNTSEPALTILSRIGRMPLPPYIKREKIHDPRDAEDLARYQTVYAQSPGAVAAPTAGLHFTQAIFDALEQRGIERAFLTLHVGLGTFKPVTVDDLAAHDMHGELYEIPASTADVINRAKSENRRVIAVGTTTARVLESQPVDQPLQPRSGSTRIFIYPPYTWKHVDALITNFHLPRSTLIALVAAMMGLDEQRRAYADAIAHKYRFFSYGDAMLIE